MKLKYDKISDAAYMRIADGKISSTVEVSEHVNVDLDSNGKIVGIEILDYSSNNDVNLLESFVVNGMPIEVIASTPVAA